jgi:hypothetical protein
VDRLLDLLHASRLDQLEAAFRLLGKTPGRRNPRSRLERVFTGQSREPAAHEETGYRSQSDAGVASGKAVLRSSRFSSSGMITL